MFGPAAQHMADFYDAVDQSVRATGRPYSDNPPRDVPGLYDRALLEKALAAIGHAESVVEADETGVGDDAAGWATFVVRTINVTQPVVVEMDVWGESALGGIVINSKQGAWNNVRPEKRLSGKPQWGSLVFRIPTWSNATGTPPGGCEQRHPIPDRERGRMVHLQPTTRPVACGPTAGPRLVSRRDRLQGRSRGKDLEFRSRAELGVRTRPVLFLERQADLGTAVRSLRAFVTIEIGSVRPLCFLDTGAPFSIVSHLSRDGSSGGCSETPCFTKGTRRHSIGNESRATSAKPISFFLIRSGLRGPHLPPGRYVCQSPAPRPRKLRAARHELPAGQQPRPDAPRHAGNATRSAACPVGKVRGAAHRTGGRRDGGHLSRSGRRRRDRRLRRRGRISRREHGVHFDGESLEQHGDGLLPRLVDAGRVVHPAA